MIRAISGLLMNIPAFRNSVSQMLGTYQSNFYSSFYAGAGLAGRNQDLTRSKPGAALAYQLIVPVFRSVQLRAQAVAVTPWRIVRNSDGQVVAKSGDYSALHPLARMFMSASRFHKESLLYLWEQSLSLYGENYIEKCLNKFKYPSGLRWLNPLAIQTQESGGRVYSYQYLTSGGSRSFNPAELSFDRIPDPADDLHGYGPTYAALDKINVDNNAHRWWAAHFRNGARPDAVISPDGEFMKQWKETDRQRIEDFWREYAKGTDNSGRTVVPPIPVKVNTFDQVDLSKQIPISEKMETDIYSTYGVSLPVAGDTSSVRYKTDAEIFSYFKAGVITEECKGIALEINSTIMPFVEECEPDQCAHRFEFDVSVFDSLTEGEKTKQEQARLNLGAGAITLNQFLQEIGQPKVDHGNVYYLPSSVRPTKPEELTAQPAKQEMTLFAAPKSEPAQITAPTPQRVETVHAQEDNAPSIIASEMLRDIERPTAPSAFEPQAGAVAYVSVDLANHPDVSNVQGFLREIFGDKLKYQDPEHFHLTLVYSDKAADAQLEALKAIQPADTVILSSSRLIILGGEGDPLALCAEVVADPRLLALQRSIYDAMSKAGSALSEFSKPESYRPHITLAYIPDGADVSDALPGVRSDLSLLARQVVVQRDEYQTVFTIPLPTAGYEHWRKRASQADATDELRAWEKMAARGVKRVFEPIHTRGDLSDWVADELNKTNQDKVAIRDIFTQARKRLEYRAITDTEVAFSSEFYALLEAAAVGDTERRQWAAGVRRILRQYGRQAYRDGLIDGGVTDEEFSPEDETEASNLISAQSEFVTNLGAKFFSEGLTMAEIATKPEMWVNKSLTPFYSAGVASANRNQMMEFVGDDGEESCETCQRLKGQRHRAKDWRRKGLWPGEDTDQYVCGGWQCFHKLVPVSGKSRGGW